MRIDLQVLTHETKTSHSKSNGKPPGRTNPSPTSMSSAFLRTSKSSWAEVNSFAKMLDVKKHRW